MITAGSQLGPYQILGPLGAGGMGEVFRARDLRLDRNVAVKVLPERFTQDTDRLARFEREAKAVAALEHPNILVLHDFATDRGVCYTVTELLEGETLRKRLAAAPLSWRKTVEIGAAVAEGLAAAHAKGIIHRDLKPDNLFLTTDDRVKILDFGLARMETQALPGVETGPYVPADTATGIVMGTVGYMSPEQVRGEHVDSRSDLFSLGCVLYEMVTGSRPFAAPSASEVHAAILRDDPPQLASVGHEVPPELERVIRRCLEKKPEARFQSARDLAFNLRALLTDAGSPRPAAPPPVRRHRPTVWIAGAVGLLVTLGGVGLYALLGRREAPPGPAKSTAAAAAIDAVAILPFERPEGDADAEILGDGISELIINSLFPLRTLKVRAFPSVVRYKGQKSLDLKKVGEELKVQAVLTGRLVRQGNQLVVSVQLVDLRDNSLMWGKPYACRFTDVFAIQEDVARQISTQLRLHLTGEEEKRLAKRPTENPEAIQFFLRGRHYLNTTADPDGKKRAIASFRQALARDPDYALAYAGLAEAYYWLSNTSQAPMEVIPEAETAARKALQLDSSLGEAHAMLGLLLAVYHWDWPAAEAEFRQAIELSPGSGIVHLYYGLCLTMAERFTDAVAEVERAKELDPSSPLLVAYASLSLYLVQKYDRAILELENLAKADETNALPYPYLGLCYEQKHEFKKAIAAFERAIELDNTNLEGKAQLAHAYAVAGERDKALTLLEKLNEPVKDRYLSPYNIALIYVGLRDKKQAFVWLEKAAEDRSEWFAFLKVDPRLEPIRTDPRFEELLKRLKLGPAGR